MADAPCATRRIGAFDAACMAVTIDDEAVALWAVADLERHVDRVALLRGDDPPEPPYWAHCWSGARVLAARVPHDARRVIEVGCGLGLPGLIAARRGADVVFLDRVATPLSFVRASLAANGVCAHLVVGDALHPPCRGRFDVVLAAEVLYDRATFPLLATALADLVTDDGCILVADGHRIDTRAFYDDAAGAGLTWTIDDVRITEEGFPTTISVVTMRRAR